MEAGHVVLEMNLDDTSDCETVQRKTSKRKKGPSSLSPTVAKRHKSRNTLEWEHAGRLNRILRSLLKQRNWKEATGVLSVLMEGTSDDRSPMQNREKHRAALQLLNKASNEGIKESRITRIFEAWMKKIGPMKKYPTEDRNSVKLESAVSFLMQGKFEKAQDVLTQISVEDRNPLWNLIVGLIFYESWYTSLPVGWKLSNIDVLDTPPSTPESSAVPTPESSKVSGMEPCNQVDFTHEFYIDESADETSENDEAHIHYNQSSNLTNASIFVEHGLDTNLFPLWLPSENRLEFIDDYMGLLYDPINRDNNYNAAVNHLRTALHSTPPVMASLLPLIQLLLLGDRVEEAMCEIEYICHHTNAVLPLRLKAILLECFDKNQSTAISTSYEGILKIDPTCSHSLTGLTTMHKKGLYDLEPLTEMIALHLDGTCAPSNIVWEEFASCFIRFPQVEEDPDATFNTIPQAFMSGSSKNCWKLRKRWWSTRHFSENAHISEIEAGDSQLSTDKAACAAHLYGPEFGYVVSVYNHLEEEEDKVKMLFLQFHRKNSVKFFENLNRVG